MTKNKKLTFQEVAAAGMLFFGCALTTAGFIVGDLGAIDNTVLWVFGQCLIFAGAILGVEYTVDKKIDKKIKNGEI